MTTWNIDMQQARDVAADWTSNNPTLLAGVIGWESDTGKFKIGDGSTAWTGLSYAGPLGISGEAIDPASIDLSAISETLTGYTVVDTATGSMSDWSDGGVNMRMIQPSTSWYNEDRPSGVWLGEAANEAAARALPGATTGDSYHNTTDGLFYSLDAGAGETEIFRGPRQGFPEEYVIVAEADRVIIFDVNDSMAMWMVFDNNGVGLIGGSIVRNGALVTSIGITDGKLSFGQDETVASRGGASLIDFVSGEVNLYNSAGTYYKFLSNIAGRNSAAGHGPSTANGAYQIINNAVNDVAITVLPDAPINLTTGMPEPTIAVATDGGLSIIQNDGTIDSNANACAFVAFIDDTRLLFGPGSWWVGYVIDWATNATRVGYYAGIGSTSSPTTLPKLLGTTINLLDANVLGSDGGLTHLKENPATPASGMVAYATTDYASGYMVGDIKGAWLASTDSTDLVGAELATDSYASVAGFDNVTTSISASAFSVAGGTTQSRAFVAFTTVIGETYVLDFVQDSADNALAIYAREGASGSGTVLATINTTSGADIGTITFVATTTSSSILWLGGTGDNYAISGISVRLADPDRSVNGNGLATYGTVTKTAVATGAELMGYSGFSASNYLEQPYNSDLDFGTGDFSVRGWVNTTTTSFNSLFHRSLAGSTGGILLQISSAGLLRLFASASTSYVSVADSSRSINSGSWVHVSAIRRAGVVQLYINGFLDVSAANSTNLAYAASVVRFGLNNSDGESFNGSLALWRISATAPSADQEAWIYAVEKFWFEENATVTLPGTSDAILDLAYDKHTGHHHVLTSWGWSEWYNGRLIDSEAGSWTKVSANNGLVVKL